MANVARPKRKVFIGEYGPITIGVEGQATYGDLIRYIRKKRKIYPDDIAMLYRKIVEGGPVSGRHILRMEQTDNFFPKDPNRRWVLAKLLRMPPELMAYLSLESIIPEQEVAHKIVFSSSTKAVDTEEYYSTLQQYWVEGYQNGVEYAIKDVKHRIYLLKDKILFKSSPEKPFITRLLCGYQVLLADIAEEQQDYTAAIQYRTDAFTLASEKECYDLQAIALKQRMVLFINNNDFDKASDDFTRAMQLKNVAAPQIWGKILTLGSMAKVSLAQDKDDWLTAFYYLDNAEKLVETISPENFLFFASFDTQRYLLDCAQACIESPTKKWRSPKKAEEYLIEAARQSGRNGKSISAYRQVANDLIQARIYCDQGYYPIAATTAENALVVLRGLESKISINRIATLFSEVKEHDPEGIEVASLELELMKIQQPYLFE